MILMNPFHYYVMSYLPLVVLTLLLISSTTLIQNVNATTDEDQAVLSWSSSVCTELGYNDSFDECAMLELCLGEPQDDYYRIRQRQRRRLGSSLQTEMKDDPKQHGREDYDEYGMDYTNNYDEYGTDYTNIYDEYGDEYDGNDSNNNKHSASYGYRIPGTEGCTWPGPLIRMQRSKSYGLFLSGSREQPDISTNLHTHGLHIAGHGNSDDATRTVSGSDTIIYNYTIPSYHMGGTYWYHSHQHGQSDVQVRGGAFGMLIVEDGTNVGTDDTNVHRFLQNELRMVATNAKNGEWMSDKSNYVMHKDEWYRFRFLTIGVDDHQDKQTLRFGEECEARAIAHDGIFRFKVPSQQIKREFVMTTASRLDVAIRCSESSSVHIDYATVATLSVTYENESENSASDLDISPFVNGIDQWDSTRPPYLVDLREFPIANGNKYNIKIGETNINEQSYSLTKPLCNHGSDFHYNTMNEWTIQGPSHPFHVHMYPMQIVSQDDHCGDVHDYGEFYDTILADDKSCTVRMNFVDVAGKVLVHCHLLRHQDQGSMGYFNVRGDGAPIQPNEPRVHACDNLPCDEVKLVNSCGEGDEDYY